MCSCPLSCSAPPPSGRLGMRVLYGVLMLQCLLIACLLMTSCPRDDDDDDGGRASLASIHDLMSPQAEYRRLRGNITTSEGLSLDISVNVPRHPPRILFNRIPKCGSSTAIDVMASLASTNQFLFRRASEYMEFYSDSSRLNQLVREIASLPTPLIYEKHTHFIDTDQFHLARPVYINIIRDPLERLASWYYFRRFQVGHIRPMSTDERIRTYDECVLGNYTECVAANGSSPEEGYYKLIPFFCGQDPFCREPSQRASAQAMFNVQEYYLVVATLEQLPQFFEVLEYLLPDYFRGASRVFKIIGGTEHRKHETTHKLPVSSEAANVMKPKLELENKFYHFIRRRFLRQLEEVRKAKDSMKF